MSFAEDTAETPPKNSPNTNIELHELIARILHYIDANRFVLFAFIALPLFFEALSWIVQSRFVLSDRAFFSIAMLNLAANTLLISLVAVREFTVLRKQKETITDILKLSFQSFPKVFLSYLGLLIAIFASGSFFPLFIFVPFLVWAPFFCLGEVFAKQDKSDSELEREEQEAKLFERKSAFDFGFKRSIRFATTCWPLTLSFILLFWFANTFPAALFSGFGVLPTGVVPSSAAAAVSSYVSAAILAVMALTFVELLPKSVEKELSIEREGLAKGVSSWSDSFRSYFSSPKNRILLSIFVVFASTISTGTLVESARESVSVPENAEFSLVKAERFGTLLKLQVQVKDTEEKLRWFDAERVALLLPATTEAQVEVSSTTESQAPASTAKGRYEEVSRVGVFTSDGSEQSLSKRLLQEEADFTFYFNSNDLVVGQPYKLIYKSFVGEHELLSSLIIPQSNQ